MPLATYEKTNFSKLLPTFGGTLSILLWIFINIKAVDASGFHWSQCFKYFIHIGNNVLVIFSCAAILWWEEVFRRVYTCLEK